MTQGAWLREEQADLAVDKILAAASLAFVELGVTRAGMADVARRAGCSRATLYRYFRNRHELQLAYVNREAKELAGRVAAEVANLADPDTRLVEGIIRSVREVRGNPATAVWFTPGDSGLAASLSATSDVVEGLASTFARELLGAPDDLTAHWLVRVIVSLLITPGESEEHERALVERFVVPGVLPPARLSPAHPSPRGGRQSA